MKLLQNTPSLGSASGIVTLILGVALAVFVLSQFDITRRLTGLTGRGKITAAA